jgi:hypothetical protein
VVIVQSVGGNVEIWIKHNNEEVDVLGGGEVGK